MLKNVGIRCWLIISAIISFLSKKQDEMTVAQPLSFKIPFPAIRRLLKRKYNATQTDIRCKKSANFSLQHSIANIFKKGVLTSVCSLAFITYV